MLARVVSIFQCAIYVRSQATILTLEIINAAADMRALMRSSAAATPSHCKSLHSASCRQHNYNAVYTVKSYNRAVQ
jgi:hypothetical protein